MALLSGIRVIDISTGAAGPFTARILGDYGAEVIKVEPPFLGDICRHWGPFPGNVPDMETSPTHLFVNANKKGITLNLATRTGRELLLRLVAKSHVLVESYPPGSLEEMGLGPDVLWGLNPRLIITSVTPFGQSGPYSRFRASHLVLAAMGGHVYMLGEPTRPPLHIGNEAFYFVAGMVGAAGTMMALYETDQRGVGRRVDVSIMETVTSCLVTPTVIWSYQTKLASVPLPPVIPGTVRSGRPFVGEFRCKDGYIGVYLLTFKHWQSMCRLTGPEELLDDPQLLALDVRWRRRQEFYELFAPWFVDRTREEVFRIGLEERIPMAMLHTPEDVLNFEPLLAVQLFRRLDHPRAGVVEKFPGAPFQFEGHPWDLRLPAPLLGQHNQEVLGGELGLDGEALALLRRGGVI